MTKRRRLSTLFAVGAGLAVGAAFRSRRFDQEIERRRRTLGRDHSTDTGTETPTEALPAPVRRYFDHVHPDDRDTPEPLRIDQHGEIRLGGTDGRWYEFEATQHVGTSPPGFVWDAMVEFLPGMDIRVVDAFTDGEGILRARAWSVFPVASAGPDLATGEGELARYLAEAAWYPWALRPENGVLWEGIDDSSARATISQGDVTASVVFHFDDGGLIERVTTDRYRQDTRSYAPWRGLFSDYEEIDGRLVPTRASAEWDLESGPAPYWRGVIDAIEPATTSR